MKSIHSLKPGQGVASLLVIGFIAILLGCGGGGSGGGGPTLDSIQVTPNTSSIAMGYDVQITVTAFYNDGTSGDITGEVDWSSSIQAVATIDGLGLVSTHSVGQTTITGTYQGQSVSATVDVTDAVLDSLTLTTAPASIANGNMAVYTATGNFSDGSSQDLTDSVTWDTSNAAIAEITAPGQFRGVTEGSATITATDPATGLDDSAVLEVTAAVLVSIAVTPADLTTAVDRTRQYAAEGTYSDATIQTITNLVTWESDTLAVATIDAAGLLQGVTVGTATISASLNGMTGSTSADIIVLTTFNMDLMAAALTTGTVISPGPVAPEVDALPVFSSAALTTDITGDQFTLTLWLLKVGVDVQPVNVRLFVDQGGLETDLFTTVVVVNNLAPAEEYITHITGIDPPASMIGGTLNLELTRDDGDAPEVIFWYNPGIDGSGDVSSVAVPLD